MKERFRLLFFFLLAAACAQAVLPDEPAPAVEDVAGQRQIIVISDLHMGLGRVQEGGVTRWQRKEDFRWPKALSGFLTHIENKAPVGIDLVIAGDFLELWQPPADVACEGPGTDAVPVDPEATDEASLLQPGDYGCTVAEMETITHAVVKAHEEELAALGRFARGGNCVHVVVGNHDAALILPSVWEILDAKMRGTDERCITLASDRWSSADRAVAVEHGHLIGRDANSYGSWPKITRRFRQSNGDEDTYLERPWGERFVQALFNDEEEDYPLIDNLSPESAGIWHRFRDRGVLRAVGDVARFLRFNLVGTSMRQTGQLLGPEDAGKEWTRNELRAGRKLGYRLFAGVLPAQHPWRVALEAAPPETSSPDASAPETASPETLAPELTPPEMTALRKELDALAAELSNEEVGVLCDLLALNESAAGCRERTAGEALHKLIHTRKRLLTPHVRSLRKRERRLKVLAYGHTHKFEVPWDATTREGKVISVVNAGAFQRLIDSEQLAAVAAANEDTEIVDLLKAEGWETFVSPCYTFVRVERTDRGPDVELRAWLMDETTAAGREEDPCNVACPKVGTGCD